MQPFFHLRDTDTLFGSQMKDSLGLKQTKSSLCQRYTYKVLETIQMQLLCTCMCLGRAGSALKFKYEI